jgi:hypothetical protein
MRFTIFDFHQMIRKERINNKKKYLTESTKNSRHDNPPLQLSNVPSRRDPLLISSGFPASFFFNVLSCFSFVLSKFELVSIVERGGEWISFEECGDFRFRDRFVKDDLSQTHTRRAVTNAKRNGATSAGRRHLSAKSLVKILACPGNDLFCLEINPNSFNKPAFVCT